MKHFNRDNYNRYKRDLESFSDAPTKSWDEYSRDELIIRLLPMVEKVSRKFSTSDQASGIMTKCDLIQAGSIGLVNGIDKIDWNITNAAVNPEKSMRSFLSKRIKGAIRRAININRGSMRIPEHKLNEIRQDYGKDKKKVALFFDSIFSSIDAAKPGEQSIALQIADSQEFYNLPLINAYLMGIMRTHLTSLQFEVIRMSYGLDCDKTSANDIAKKLGIDVKTAHVRISQIKRDALSVLIENTSQEQVLDFL